MKIPKLLTICFVVLVTMGLVAPVMASQVEQKKDVTPLQPNLYHVGDTISYELTVGNPAGNSATNYIDNLYDTDPHGVVHYFIEPGVDPVLVQEPGDSQMYPLDYVVLPEDVLFSNGARRVINRLNGSGVDSQEDNVTISTERNSKIITPCISIDKTVEPTVAVPGDEVVYTYTICNCGDTDLTLTDLEDDRLDDLMPYVPADGMVLTGGVYNGEGQLQPGECTTFMVPYTVQESDPDPLCNEVCVTGVDIIGGDANDCDRVCLDLLDPGIEIVKTCDEYSKVGDVIDYDVTITNIGDVALEIVDVNDTVVGPLLDCVGTILDPNDTCGVSYNHTVQQGDGDPLINTVTVLAEPVGFASLTVEDSTTCSTDLVHPSFTVTKECLTDPVEGTEAQFRITITNLGDVALIITTDEIELPGPNDLNVGSMITFDATRAVLDGADTVDNTVNVTATLPLSYGLDNILTESATASCSVPGAEGCTPGYWKNSPDCWCVGYEPTDDLDTVFEFPAGTTYGTGYYYLGDRTLSQALRFKGGKSLRLKAAILLRAATAALLNSCSDNVDYAISEAAVIAEVNAALASKNKTTILDLATLLDDYNNEGCPLSSQKSNNPCERNVDEY